MAKLPARRIAPHIAVIGGQPTTTSRDIAETFGKRHADVLARIRSLDCTKEFNERNFSSIEYLDGKGVRNIEYRITRDGFSFLCMGFTGARAAQWKEKYIDTFNRMADKLAHRAAKPVKAVKLPPQLQATLPPADVLSVLGLASAMGTLVQQTVFMAVLDEGSDWKNGRWVMEFIKDSKRAAPPIIRRLDDDERITTATDIAAINLAVFAHAETARALTNIQAERTRLATKGNK